MTEPMGIKFGVGGGGGWLRGECGLEYFVIKIKKKKKKNVRASRDFGINE